MKKIALIMALILLGFTALPAMAQTPTEATASQSQTQAADANDPSKMFPAEAEKAFKQIRDDPDPDALVRDAHYWISNENAHYVWYPHIKDLGGVISGVGTDQVYLLAGWSNASVIVPLDFDRKIRDLHFAYGVAFLSSQDTKEFIAFWKKDNADRVKELAQQYFPDRADDIFQAWKLARSNVQQRIRLVTKKYTSNEIPTFITDETQFNRIKQLWTNHRVFPVCGDLTGDKAMIDLAKAINQSGLKLQILYPSNAEHYFEYGPAYRRNIINLPFADNGLVLRTRQMRSLGLAEPEDYHYNMQTGENFKIWLQTTQIPNQHSMLKKRVKTKTEGLSILERVPDPSKVPPQIAPMP